MVCYLCEMWNPPVTTKPMGSWPPDISLSQHGGCWWPGAYLVPDCLQPSWGCSSRVSQCNDIEAETKFRSKCHWILLLRVKWQWVSIGSDDWLWMGNKPLSESIMVYHIDAFVTRPWWVKMWFVMTHQCSDSLELIMSVLVRIMSYTLLNQQWIIHLQRCWAKMSAILDMIFWNAVLMFGFRLKFRWIMFRMVHLKKVSNSSSNGLVLNRHKWVSLKWMQRALIVTKQLSVCLFVSS